MKELDPNLSAFRAFLLGELDVLEGHRRSLARFPGRSVDVHKMRVSTRRVREALGLLRHASGERLIGEWMDRTRRVTRSLGESRALDVSVALLKREFRRTSPRAADYAVHRLSKRRLETGKELLAELEDFKARKLRKAVKKILKREHKNLGRHWMEAGLDRLGRREEKIGEKFAQQGMMEKEGMHAFRVGLKKLRYHLEILARSSSEGRAGYARRVKALKKHQSLLGRWHDYEVLRGHLAPFDGKVGGMKALIERVGDRETDAAARVLKTFENPSERKAFLA